MNKTPLYTTKTCIIFLCLVYATTTELNGHVRNPSNEITFAGGPPKRPVIADTSDLNSFEMRAAAFYPTDHKFREFYGNVGLSVAAEIGRTFKGFRHFGLWAQGEWIGMHGKPSHSSCGSTSIDIFNISFGPKWMGFFFNDFLSLYGSIGPNVGLIYLENKIRCCSSCKTTEHRSRAAIGGIVKTGAEIYFKRHFYFSFFVDYLYLPVHMGRTIEAGGFKGGAGLGARF